MPQLRIQQLLALENEEMSVLFYALFIFLFYLGIQTWNCFKLALAKKVSCPSYEIVEKGAAKTQLPIFITKFQMLTLHSLFKWFMYLTDLSALALFIIRESEFISAMAQYNLDPKAATDFSSVFTIQKYFTDMVGLSLALES